MSSSSSARDAHPLAAPDRITVVSGLPRAGTSLVMQLLAAAGLPIAEDEARPPDLDNPRGYLELAAVKALRRDASFLEACRGRAVKIVAPLLPALPTEYAYRVLFVERDLDEVLASQRAMLQRRGGSSQAPDAEADLGRAFAASLAHARAWLAARPDVDVLPLAHRELLSAPRSAAERVVGFLSRTSVQGAAPDGSAWIDAMVRAVDPALYRQRR